MGKRLERCRAKMNKASAGCFSFFFFGLSLSEREWWK